VPPSEAASFELDARGAAAGARTAAGELAAEDALEVEDAGPPRRSGGSRDDAVTIGIATVVAEHDKAQYAPLRGTGADARFAAEPK
jgi:hypothetical protein